jgi:hypothetical protein
MVFTILYIVNAVEGHVQYTCVYNIVNTVEGHVQYTCVYNIVNTVEGHVQYTIHTTSSRIFLYNLQVKCFVRYIHTFIASLETISFCLYHFFLNVLLKLFCG